MTNFQFLFFSLSLFLEMVLSLDKRLHCFFYSGKNQQTKMQVLRFVLIILISMAASARRSRPNKSRPRGCSFEGKKKNEKTCTPFWKIKQPNCHAMNAHRIKRTECSKKFCWKIVDSKTRKGNSNIPSEGTYTHTQPLTHFC